MGNDKKNKNMMYGIKRECGSPVLVRNKTTAVIDEEKVEMLVQTSEL